MLSEPDTAVFMIWLTLDDQLAELQLALDQLALDQDADDQLALDQLADDQDASVWTWLDQLASSKYRSPVSSSVLMNSRASPVTGST